MKIQYGYCGLEVCINCWNPDGFEANPAGFLKSVEEFVDRLNFYEHIDIRISRLDRTKEENHTEDNDKW